MAEWTGLEPATPGVTGQYSNQLNYHSTEKTLLLTQTKGNTIIHENFSLRCNTFVWVLRDSNPRHSPCKGDALPTELSTHAHFVWGEKDSVKNSIRQQKFKGSCSYQSCQLLVPLLANDATAPQAQPRQQEQLPCRLSHHCKTKR